MLAAANIQANFVVSLLSGIEPLQCSVNGANLLKYQHRLVLG